MARTRHWRAAVAALAMTAAMLTGSVASSSPANAHAQVTSIAPADGSMLRKAPREVQITFNEQVGVEAGNVQLLDSSGSIVAATVSVQPGSRTVKATPRQSLQPGRYAIRWAAVSADGHPISGASAFSVGKTSGRQTSSSISLLPRGSMRVRSTSSGQVEILLPTPARSGTVTLTNPRLGAPLSWDMSGNGKQASSSGMLPWPGQWAVTITLRTGAFTEQELAGTLNLP